MAGSIAGVSVTERATRVVASLSIGIAAGWLCAVKATTGTDFEFFWRAARFFAIGVDPYALRPDSPGWPLPDVFFYPAPALLVVWPLQYLAMPVAAAIFMGVGSGLLAWLISAEGAWRLWLMGSPAFLMAAAMGQWSPLITVGALLPTAAFLLACKPTIGLAAFCYRASLRAMASVALIVALSLILLPEWPREWLSNIKLVEGHPPPIATPWGWLVLVALVRWRQPEARLLLAMACVPQLLFFADQLALGLVARTRQEAVALAACGVLAFAGWWAMLGTGDPYVREAQPFVIAGLYLPALVVVLARPNAGIVPLWIDTLLARLRRNLRPEAERSG